MLVVRRSRFWGLLTESWILQTKLERAINIGQCRELSLALHGVDPAQKEDIDIDRL